MFPKLNQHLQMDFENYIPNTLNQTLLKDGLIALIIRNFRTLRRHLILAFSRQTKLQLTSIPTTAKTILWLNISSTSIGDSIMELSGRSLLPTHLNLDLLTDGKNAALYVEDNHFNNVYTNINECNTNNYDLILIDINNTKSLVAKTRFFKKTPFCSIQGFFYGCDFNRMLFSYNRINALLNYPIVPQMLNKIAHNYLYVKLDERISKPNNMKFIAISIGGEDYVRTYNKWLEVFETLHKQAQNHSFNLNTLHISLVGLEKDTNFSEQIMQHYSDKLTIDNLVNKLDLLTTAKLISQHDYFVGCDGGLMHIAEAFNLKGVALFANYNPELRLAHNSNLISLYSKQLADEIAPSLVVDSLIELLV